MKTPIAPLVALLLFACCTSALGADVKTQGVFFRNQCSRDVQVIVSIDGVAHKFILPASKCGYVYTRGKFLNQYVVDSDGVHGFKARNIAFGFQDEPSVKGGIYLSPSMVGDENETLPLDPASPAERFEKSALIEVPGDIRHVKVISYAYAPPAKPR